MACYSCEFVITVIVMVEFYCVYNKLNFRFLLYQNAQMIGPNTNHKLTKRIPFGERASVVKLNRLSKGKVDDLWFFKS